MSFDVARRAALLAAVAGLLAGPAAAQSGSVTGRVTDAESGQALAGARISAIAVGGTVAAQGVTGAAGEFSLGGLAEGSYALSVSLLGYEDRRVEAVRVVAGEASIVGIQLRTSAFSLNPIVVSVSKQMEKALDAPASVSVVGEREIEARPTITPVDHLRSTPGVDIITQGLQSTNVVARGFNNIFSGALHMLSDYRLAGVPSLRVNVMQFVPTTSEDLQRMEVILGPGSALYGPNTANGVLHMITKSPLVDEGTSVSLSGGERSVFQGTFRTAQRVSDALGVKVSGQYTSGEEWSHVDAVEAAEQAKFAANPQLVGALANALGVTQAEAAARVALIGARDRDLSRWSGEARVDWQVADEATAVFQAGLTSVGTGIEATGLGAAQVEDWRYAYYQARGTWRRFFGQVYLNTSDAGDTYLLRTGQPIVDESTLLVGQLQHGLTLGDRQNFVYGVDYFYTNPQTQGTINGIYEDEDETTEIGAYIQSETQLSDQFELVLAARVDDHNALPDPIFSPRAAIVWKPEENQAFRLTFNRAFSTPTSLNQFLDLPTAIPDANAALLGYSVRVQGTGTTGFHFRQADGSYLMRSPFTPAALGGPAQLLPASAASFWGAAVQVAAQIAASRGAPLDPQLVGFLLTLRPTAAQIGTNAVFPGSTNSQPLGQTNIPDVDPIRESTTMMFEAGYKGIIRDRLLLAADLWFSRRENFVTPLTLATPFVALNGQETAAFLVQNLVAGLGMPQQQAAAVAAQLAPALAGVPLGVISSGEVNANGAQLLATYTNVDDQLDYWGTDFSATALLNDSWSVTGTASLVSDDHFDTDEVGVVTLNAPERKGSLALTYRQPEAGFSGEARARFNSEFPTQSGVYTGTACIEPDNTLAGPCVEQYTLFDLLLGYRVRSLPGASLQLNVQNVFDEDYVSYPGLPPIGRLALLRLRYEF